MTRMVASQMSDNSMRMRFLLVSVALLLAAACQRATDTALEHLHPCQIAEGPPDAFCGTTGSSRTARQRPAAPSI